MTEQPGTDWARFGMLLDEMAAAGLLVELHRTSGKGNFSWSFAWRSTYQAQKTWFYGETARQAIERGHAKWVEAWEAGQG